MKFSLIFLFLMGFGSSAYSQDLDFVKRQVELLTDSSFYGRGYVNNGSNLASQYIAESFEEMGLAPAKKSFLQPFTFEVNTFPEEVLFSSQDQEFEVGKDFIVDPQSGTSEGTYKTVQLDSTYFNQLPFGEISKNRVPVIDLAGIDTPDERAALHSFKKERLQTTPVVLLRPGKTTWSVGVQQYKYALVEVDSRAIEAPIKKVSFSIKPVQIAFEANNVIGKIAGERSDSLIVITAHLDHLGMLGSARFPGASDNASGTATMLDLANYYTSHKPKFDTYFIGFAGEEAGLLGSKYFVDHPMIELNRVKLLINFDLMGSAAEGITVVNGKLYPELMTELSALNTELGSVPKIKLRGKAANSDHYWFSERGVPSIFIYTLGNAKAYHDVNDKPQGLDWANYNELFTLMVQFISQL